MMKYQEINFFWIKYTYYIDFNLNHIKPIFVFFHNNLF